jgi:hypothetical protein
MEKNQMSTTEIGEVEYRLDLRGKAGKVDRVKIVSRHGGGKFRPLDGDFTKQDAAQFRAFAKMASIIAKGTVPPLDVEQALRDVNRPRRNKRTTPKQNGPHAPQN